MTICLSPNGPMVADGGLSDRLLVATIDGIVTLEKGPDGWREEGRSLQGHHFSALVAVPGSNIILAGTHGQGVFRSSDGGVSWSSANTGITKTNVFSLAAVQTEGGVRVLAGTEPVSLFISDDLGESWEERSAVGEVPGHDKWTFPVPPHDAHLKSIALVPGQPDSFFACIEQGALLKTDDGGKSWRELASYYRDSDKWYRDIHKLVPHPAIPGCLLMSTGMGFYRSEDSGENWVQLTDLDFAIRYPDHLLVLPDEANSIVLSGAGQSPDQWRNTHLAGATVQFSRDGGRHWEDMSQGLQADARPAIEAMCIAADGPDYRLYLGDTDGNVFERGPGDVSWRLIASGIGPVSKVGHYRHVQKPATAS